MNSAFVQVLTAIAMVLTIVVPMTYYFKGEHNKNRYKKSLAANVSGFFGLLLIATVVSFAGATTASAATEAGAGLATGLGYIGAALLQVFPVLVPVSPLHLPQAQLLEQSAKTAASLVNP